MDDKKIPGLKTKTEEKNEVRESCELILPTCGPSLITPKGQWRDPDTSDDNKNKNKRNKNKK